MPAENLPDQARTDRDRLVTYARPEMENLYQQLDSTTMVVALADQQGLLLSMVGIGSARLATQRELVLCEADAPNLDTVTVTPRPLAPAQQDAPPRTHALQVVAAPILGNQGGRIAFFSIGTPPSSGFGHAAALLQTTAAIIEHRLIASDERGFLLLHFHNRAGLLGSPLEALIAFDRDSRMLARNHVANGLLEQCDDAGEHRLADFFSAQWTTLLHHAFKRRSRPFTLRPRHGGDLHARAQLR